MNKIEQLPKNLLANNKYYEPKVYTTAWENWCISYKSITDKETLFFVVVEPDDEPIKINCSPRPNSYIGSAKSLDDAVDMVLEYIKNHYEI